MLHEVDVGEQSINAYTASAGVDAVTQLVELAKPLVGSRVLHLSATPYGGGVAEILRSEVPLLRDLGLDAHWNLISGDDRFFAVTKDIHNGLQGAVRSLSASEQETYLAYSARNATLLDRNFDVVIVHDPQPLAIPNLRTDDRTHWIWRCHIDTSQPNQEVWEFLRPFLNSYAAGVFTLGGFVPPDFPVPVEIIPPAIDPESPKNIELDAHLARRLLTWIGVDVDRPVVSQVSRFDPWKDPLGVIAAYRLVREEIPDLQLVLAGSMALDDPEGWEVYRQIQDTAAPDPGIHVFTNLTGVSSVEINALQRLSDVIIQKSLREGFGLVVSESLWKHTPVVAGRAGGIPLQLQDGVSGYLIDSVQECAARTVELLRDPERRRALGRAGHELVSERFLLTRLIADELRLLSSVMSGGLADHVHRAAAGMTGKTRDPVCGMPVNGSAHEIVLDSETFAFCSGSCAAQFAASPEIFRRAQAHR
jgi:trehalose synthase